MKKGKEEVFSKEQIEAIREIVRDEMKKADKIDADETVKEVKKFVSKMNGEFGKDPSIY